MFTPRLRFVLLVLLLLVASFAAAYNKIPVLVVAALCSIFLLWGYYKMSTVALALKELRKNDLDEAQRILDFCTRPEKLLKPQKAYYYFIKGYIAREKDYYDEAIAAYEQALDLGLKVDNDKAIALLSITDIYMLRKDITNAKRYFYRMKDLKVQPGLMEPIRKMQTFLEA